MTQRSVYGVMQELQQLRANVAALSEKNYQLAKALTTVKQELTKARTAQTAVFSNKVAEWMEARGKSVEVRHQAIQCSFQELDQGTCASVEDMQSEPDPPLSPRRSAMQMVDSESKDYECSDGSEDAPRSEVCKDVTPSTTGSALKTASATNFSGLTFSLSPQRSGPPAGVKRRLRQRDDSLSYVEPKLNTKLRRGDNYGLGKRSPLRTANQPSMTRRPPKPRVISEHRDATSAFVPSLFGQQCSPFRRRTARPVKRISYAEPKLNTKLRQGDKFTFTA